MTKKRKTIYIVIIIIFIILVAARLSLPYFAKKYINKELDNIEGYHASIENVDMSVFRGAFGIGDLLIYEEASASPDTPFVRLPRMDFSIDWKALFKGKIVSKISMDSLELNFTRFKEEESEEENPRINFAQRLKEISPLEINRWEITNAKIAYRDPTTSPQVNVFLDDFHMIATNLTNVENPDVELPASFTINSKAMGDGSMVVYADLNILQQTIDFDVNFSFEDIDLVLFNRFMEAYANLSLDSGILDVYAEMVGRSGAVTGYIKPLIEDFSVNTDKEGQNIFEEIFDEVADIAGNILENKEKDRVASRVEISGDIEKLDASIWQTIFSLLKNAFIEAYAKEIENAINFGSTNPESK